MKTSSIKCVIRKCCLGPNCVRDHGATSYDRVKKEYTDARVWVVQFVHISEKKLELCAQNWKQYEAKVVSVDEALTVVASDSAEWLRTTLAAAPYS